MKITAHRIRQASFDVRNLTITCWYEGIEESIAHEFSSLAEYSDYEAIVREAIELQEVAKETS